MIIRLPERLNDDQRKRLETIAGKCPVHRTLKNVNLFEERIETF